MGGKKIEFNEQTAAAIIESWFAHDAAVYNNLWFKPYLDPPRKQRLPKVLGGWVDMAYMPLLSGELAIMRANFDFREAWGQRRRSWDEHKIPKSARVRVSVFDAKRETQVFERAFLYPFPLFDRLADGNWVIADDTAWPDGNNACLIDHNGQCLKELDLGENPMHLQADPKGGFWVGYGDIGVYHSENKVSNGGVVWFDALGAPGWSFNDQEDERLPIADHCYALNVSDHGAWAYTYTDFHLTRMERFGRSRSYRAMIDFADVFMINRQCAVFSGIFKGNAKSNGLDRMAASDFPKPPSRRRMIPGWDGAIRKPVNPKEAMCIGRGDTLHIVRGRHWYRLSIDEFEAMAPSAISYSELSKTFV